MEDIEKQKEEEEKNSFVKIGPTSNKFEHPMHEYEDFLYDKLFKKLKENPDEVRFTTIQLANEKVQEWSDERTSYLKSKFDDILKNIASLETKVMTASFKRSNFTTFKKKYK
mmetsp:Transcript_1799/g.1587  ORF Transcript_1799/g.1587 Transcript_1799/m.1587 type:complete len:112 (+) Transcript_1799:181-516(+)